MSTDRVTMDTDSDYRYHPLREGFKKKSTNLGFWLNLRRVGVDRIRGAQPPEQVFNFLLIML